MYHCLKKTPLFKIPGLVAAGYKWYMHTFANIVLFHRSTTTARTGGLVGTDGRIRSDSPLMMVSVMVVVMVAATMTATCGPVFG